MAEESKAAARSGGFRCVHCGGKVEELFYRIGQDICLSQCTLCGQVADHYIEFEALLVFIDMQLLRPEVYRHLLFNRFKDSGLRREAWRFLLLGLLLDTYHRWFCLPEVAVAGFAGSQSRSDWPVLGATVVETVVYLLTLSFAALSFEGCRPSRKWRVEAHLNIWEAVSISSFGKIFGLVGPIWGSASSHAMADAMDVALALFVAASNVLAVQMVLGDAQSNCRWAAAMAVAAGHAGRYGAKLFLTPLSV
ncbi:unnamed protein product [Effrenium voratum]|uniref:Protein ARV n=1 Tax=Effrenium voratum TaxID=2562239 RepID=A0AA36NEP1_9DINO|nr:unnamed protein product [Effrenium voratum]CAJ1399398.1 unnamed protein product [Effrenium voratum]